MSLISRITTWTAGQILKAADLNGEFNNIVNLINNLDNASTTWTNVKATTITPVTNNIAMGGLKLTGLGAGTVAGDSVRFEQVGLVTSYRRPVLQYASGTVVNIESGLTGTAGQVAILFPDGTLRTDSTTTRINCNLAQVASLTGTAQSGVQTGTVSNNTWYAIYAVKSQVNTTDIVAVASTVVPIQSGFATLNTNFGTGSWVYLGMIAFGNNSNTVNAILKFFQAGNATVLYQTCTGNANAGLTGIRLATSASATSATWTYATGGGIASAQVPNQFVFANYQTATGGGETVTTITDSAAAINWQSYSGAATFLQSILDTLMKPISVGVKLTVTGAAALDVHLTGWVDGVLGVGPNPLL